MPDQVELADPWLLAADPDYVVEAPAEKAPPALVIPGPAVPLGDGEEPVDLFLPVRQVSEKVKWWWVGAHGGAAETTMTAQAPGTAESGHCWPVDSSKPTDVVVLARTHAAGLEAARKVGVAWHSGDRALAGVKVRALVLVYDAPKVPRELLLKAKAISGLFPVMYRLPWVEPWRLGNPLREGIPDSYSKVFAEISRQIEDTNLVDSPTKER